MHNYMDEKSSIESVVPHDLGHHSYFWCFTPATKSALRQAFVKLSSPPPMSSPTTSSSNFRPIFDAALSDYVKQTGIDLSTHPFAQTLQDSTSPDAIIDLLGDKAKQFQAYRDGNRKLINCLKPVVQVLHTVSGILAEAATLVSRNGSCCLI